MEGLACIGILLWLIGIIFACLALMFLLFGNEDFADCVMKICAFFRFYWIIALCIFTFCLIDY